MPIMSDNTCKEIYRDRVLPRTAILLSKIGYRDRNNIVHIPTLYEAQMFLLDVHWRYVDIVTDHQSLWGFRVRYPMGCSYESSKSYRSYSEALSDGIHCAAKLLWDVMKLNMGG